MNRKSLKNQPYHARRCAIPTCGRVFKPRVYAGGLQAFCDKCEEAMIGPSAEERQLVGDAIEQIRVTRKNGEVQ